MTTTRTRRKEGMTEKIARYIFKKKKRSGNERKIVEKRSRGQKGKRNERRRKAAEKGAESNAAGGESRRSANMRG